MSERTIREILREEVPVTKNSGGWHVRVFGRHIATFSNYAAANGEAEDIRAHLEAVMREAAEREKEAAKQSASA